MYFLDNLDGHTDINEQETEADRKTGHILKVGEIIAKAEPYKSYFTRARLNEITRNVALSPLLRELSQAKSFSSTKPDRATK